MSLNVLIVEDNPDWEVIWKLILDVFSDKPHITWATSVIEAIAQIKLRELEEKKFDIIISDIFLSGSLTGLDFFNQLSDENKSNFLFVSSVSSKKVKALFKALQIKIYVLQKPFGIKQAVSILREIFYQHKKIDQSKLEKIF